MGKVRKPRRDDVGMVRPDTKGDRGRQLAPQEVSTAEPGCAHEVKVLAGKTTDKE